MTTTIAELFERDPLSLTDADLDLIIAKQREFRAQFQLGQKAPAEAKAKRPAKALQPLADTKSLDLDLL